MLVGGLPGHLTWDADGNPVAAIAFTVAGGRITAIAIVVDPAKLAAIPLSAPE